MRLKMDNYDRRWDNDKRRWVYKHRELMEVYLERALLPDEQVHHINGDVRDNHIENLAVVTVASHMSKHSPVYQRIWRPVSQIPSPS